MTTEMTVAEKFEVADPEELAELADELEGIDGVQFERIKIPSGGGIAWEVPGDDPENPDITKELVGVIIDDHPAAALWLDKAEGENNPPDAFSMDGKTQQIREESIEKFEQRGLPMPHEDLASCPYNQFGSAASLLGQDGRGKATKNVWRLYLLEEGAHLPKLVTLAPTSLKTFKNFKVNRVVGRGKRLCDVVVRITLRKESSNGNDYSVAQFAVVGALDDETRAAMRKMREGIRPLTRRVEISDADYEAEPVLQDSAPVESPVMPAPSDDEIPM